MTSKPRWRPNGTLHIGASLKDKQLNMNNFSNIIAKALHIGEPYVLNTLALIDEGATIPFISRYRKEKTGGMDEVQIGQIDELYSRLKELAKRKETIVRTITEAGAMTTELQLRIDDCWDATLLEDIYLPYRPKRRTRAQIAREKGLEPLANIIMLQRERNIEGIAARWKSKGISVEEALAGAKDIIAEIISEDEGTRNAVRGEFRRFATITSKVNKAQKDQDEAVKFSDYFDFSEPLSRCSSHRLLAMRRGEDKGVLRVSIDIDRAQCADRLKRHYVRGQGECQRLMGEAVDDALKRLLAPSIETEYAHSSKDKADEEAIAVFAEGLRQLLLAAPLGQKRVLAIDPGFANGCKTVCLDELGTLLHHEIIYPHPPQRKSALAAAALQHMADKYKIEAIAIGNGTASRETTEWLRSIGSLSDIPYYVVSEDGASIYSASKIAREEFPDEDVTVRGAVSIGRRLMDPLSELVKIDPKSIGVGQYQHDVDQTKLKHALDNTVMSCVNHVGVNVNTASAYLLSYVSGLGMSLAQNIVAYRSEHGAFTSRSQLKKVPRLGPVAYQQCAGFLRINGAKNPLDNSAVHPESYHIVEQMAKDLKCSIAELIKNKEIQKQIKPERYVSDTVGLPTLNDILAELEKPGRDPRMELETFEFDASIKSIDDLQEGMILPGIVTNVTQFGAFVDIGIHQDGLVHISQLANKFVSDPSTVVKLQQHVTVKVIGIDHQRHRISLSMRDV